MSAGNFGQTTSSAGAGWTFPTSTTLITGSYQSVSGAGTYDLIFSDATNLAGKTQILAGIYANVTGAPGMTGATGTVINLQLLAGVSDTPAYSGTVMRCAWERITDGGATTRTVPGTTVSGDGANYGVTAILPVIANAKLRLEAVVTGNATVAIGGLRVSIEMIGYA